MIHDISVIIPVKNEEDLPHLKLLLEELCRQSDRYRLEIILPVLDGFKKVSDMTYRLKDKFEYIPPISATEGVQGIINARNFGVLSAEGDIIIHLDCDNILDNDFIIHQLVTPIIDLEVVMTYPILKYDVEQGHTPKEIKLIKYNNFLLRFSFIPQVPFAIWKDVYQGAGGLEERNTMLKFCGKVLWAYPGGIKKIDKWTLVSPRHILEKAKIKKKQNERNNSNSNSNLQRGKIPT